MTIVSDDDDDGEIKTVAPIVLGREGEGLGQLGIGLEDSTLGVGDDGTFCCKDDDLIKVTI